jgi:hypothetical protein
MNGSWVLHREVEFEVSEFLGLFEDKNDAIEHARNHMINFYQRFQPHIIDEYKLTHLENGDVEFSYSDESYRIEYRPIKPKTSGVSSSGMVF